MTPPDTLTGAAAPVAVLRRAVALCNRIPHTCIALLGRFSIAAVF